MKIKHYIDRISDNGKKEDMIRLGEMMADVLYELKEYDEHEFEECEMELYKMAYGEVLSEEMAEEIISKMQPYHMHWSLQETKSVQQQMGMTGIRDIDFWVVMNSAYNDYRDIFDDDLEMYVKYSKDFIEDEDAKENKVFNYFTKIVK